uniref:Putative conserved plasma membrane protein n=2 Tax=Anopheles triannulatus TaxID=58253 RepID=A0A2M4ACT6_9DIPT
MALKSNIAQNVMVVLVLLLTVMTELVAPAAVLDGGQDAEYCPKMCSCDIVDGLKRADCSNEHLISTHTGIPSGVEILDLSLNMVSSIEDDNLATCDNLVKLFLSENSIETISLNAFAGLSRLKTLDLSHNRLEQLDQQLFEQNGQLVELNLAHNNFMMLSNRPFLTSNTIRMLDLSGCRIPQIFDATFSELPNLQQLDLSKNVMISLSHVPFAKLRSLSWIELTDNRWNCGSKSVRSTIRLLKKQITTIHVENCLLTDRDSWGNEFERMLVDPHATGRNDRVEVPIEEVWGNGTGRKRHSGVVWPKFMNYTCSYRENDAASQESCDQFIECQLSFGELYNQLISGRNSIQGRRGRQMIFVGGMIVGMLIGSFGTYIIYWAIRSCRKRRSNLQQPAISDERKQFHQELRREFRARNRFAHSRLKESPIAERHGRARRGSLDEEIYQNHEHTRQFLVNLFSKRQPRYLRNNSQIANINNRHVPPAATREPRDPSVPHAGSAALERAWNEQNSENFERERMLIRANAIEELSQPTWVSIRPTTSGGGTLPRNSRPAQELPTASETPPPPYAEFALNLEPKGESDDTR